MKKKIELVPSETQLAGCVERIRAVKAALKVAIARRNEAQNQLTEAEHSVRDLKEKLGVARGALMQAADAGDELDVSW